MKIKLLIATLDKDYAEYLSSVLSEKHADTFDVSLCSSAERMQELLTKNKYDVGLLDTNFTAEVNSNAIRLPLSLVDESGIAADSNNDLRKIRKYQRISTIAGNVLEGYAEVGANIAKFGDDKVQITAVWSPCGGTGKTSVALAYAANRVSAGKQTTYLNLENFSSTSAYFPENGRSISKVFEKLESNVDMFLLGIRQQDSGSGIFYFGGPENYDDMNILNAKDIETLINACATETDELVVDLSSQCDERIQKAFDIADTIFLVCDASSRCQVKLAQFINQHNVFGRIQEKLVLVNNKGAKIMDANISKTVNLPQIQSYDPVSVFKTLSGGNFDG